MQHPLAKLLSVAITLLVLISLPPRAIALSDAIAPELAQIPSNGTSNGSSFVTTAVNRVGDSVVRIDTERVVTRNFDPFPNDPFFERFFGEDFFPTPAPREQLQRGQGSGFIVDATGTILTNAHVVNRADRVTVRLKDGRDLDGRVAGVDSVTDLAVIKVNTNGRDLPVAPLGDSDMVQVGDWAIAVGNPLGLDNTVTLGIVSTLNRSSAQVGIPDKRLDFIQTDAAINPGNSGGPLLNARGEVIGVNTAIRADANGIGFAIPINTVKAVSDRLARGESIAHPFIGIQMISLTPDLARENNRDPNAGFTIPEENGVLVMRVLAASPAEEAGLRRGDVITQIDRQPVTSAEDLQRQVEESQVGQVLRLQVIRGDRTLSLRVRTGELQADAR
ncbi:MAG: HhoA/HhoB/HtrA family serine endopeptidase [Sodalinema sp.]|uniref:HhoA/HhoB/HtrA family serine endopeptidase n=1 Tax=Sodalinema sp. TaxID=3080550 RepID=UPI00396F3A32